MSPIAYESVDSQYSLSPYFFEKKYGKKLLGYGFIVSRLFFLLLLYSCRVAIILSQPIEETYI